MTQHTHVHGCCPNCADTRAIPRSAKPDDEITCGWCTFTGPVIEWVKRARAERARMGFDVGPGLDA